MPIIKPNRPAINPKINPNKPAATPKSAAAIENHTGNVMINNIATRTGEEEVWRAIG